VDARPDVGLGVVGHQRGQLGVGAAQVQQVRVSRPQYQLAPQRFPQRAHRPHPPRLPAAPPEEVPDRAMAGGRRSVHRCRRTAAGLFPVIIVTFRSAWWAAAARASSRAAGVRGEQPAKAGPDHITADQRKHTTAQRDEIGAGFASRPSGLAQPADGQGSPRHVAHGVDERPADGPAPGESAGGLPAPGDPTDSAVTENHADVNTRLIGGRYRLAAPIGRGAMGTVWRARDDLLHRDVAIKEVRLPASVSEAERDNLCQRTLREARTAARLSHPSVAAVHDVVEELGRPWIVMELVNK